MDKPTSNEIVSSIFRKYEGQFLSMPEMRNEVKKLSKSLFFQEPADPERTARTFYDKGFLQRDDSSNYCYDSSKLSNSLKTEFCNYQYLYDKLPKNFEPTAFIKIPLGKVPENENAIDYLAAELKKYKEKDGETNGIKYFTLKYAKEIDEKEIKPDELWAKTNTEPNTGKSNNLTSLFDIIKKNNEIDYSSDNKINGFTNSLKSDATLSAESSKNLLSTKPFKQIIFYGVPGCGKSHKLSEMLKDKNQFKIDSEEEQIARTVFHPDYTNSDFVGQIMPAVDNGKIEYKFTPGPFTKILAKALKHSENQYVLVIEEINRGNAASIFGEIFQLLDRIKSGKTTKEKLRDGTLNTYGEGWSEYFFMNDEINHYILKECNGDESNKSVNISGICFSENTGIRLPPNLSILATMNTSDQNVFTLDNAFQRRWDMKYIPNKIDYEKAPPEQKNQFDSTIGTTKIKWGVFRDVVNEFIANPENSFSNAEDKQLGLFFINTDVDISEKSGNIKEDEFANKVLKYLWNDIFKRRLSESSIFNENIKTFGELVSAFNGEKAFENCFDGNFVESIKEINKELENE